MRYGSSNVVELSDALSESLGFLRDVRGFDPVVVRDLKVAALNDYFAEHGLGCAVVGVSGGVDSAVVLGLVVEASRRPGSPIVDVVAVSMPCSESMSNVSSSVGRARDVCSRFGVECFVLDVSGVHEEVASQVSVVGVGDAWASGQLVAQVRTPVLYYVTSVKTAAGVPAVVVGTTNRDEGAFLGYVGKVSDGMVDVQPIADLHKSEVLSLASLLGVPGSVVGAVPAGDMFDGRTDVEVFGASYDCVELFLLWRNLSSEQREFVCRDWSDDDWEVFEGLSESLMGLHSYNAHKFLVGSPAVHLDVLESRVRGGWGRFADSGYDRVVNPVVGPVVGSDVVDCSAVVEMVGPVRVYRGLVSPEFCADLIGAGDAGGWVGSDRHGSVLGPTSDGTLRASVVDPVFADLLARVVARSVVVDDSVDVAGVWRSCGVNEVFRFVRYVPGSVLVPHFDAPFYSADGLVSLQTFLLFLGGEGSTVFYEFDAADGFADRGSADGLVETCRVVLAPGDVAVFDHRLLHTGVGCKTVLRSDIMFQRSGVRL